jgi:YidC/Oxa1 family membrane protein insertase
MWDLIINPFVTLLTWMYAILGNDVVLAIVVFTVLVRILTFPLMAKQQQSAKRMQELQPRLKKLQEKFKDDREKLAQAQMELYKEAGVNPFGGCLPLLIQFPILIALYQAIYFALANTPYQLVDLSERLIVPGLDNLIPLNNMWLGMDLTQPPIPPINPVYALALPLLVMVTTYIQSKMTLSATGQNTSTNSSGEMDQAAAMARSMTTIMPIMLGAFALSFSVGLSVYFITSNILGIIQYSPWGKQLVERFAGGERKAKDFVLADEEVIKPAAKAAASTGNFSTNGTTDGTTKKTKKKKTR